MGKIAIVTDSNSGITQAQAEELGVYVIPMPFYINEKMYLEGVTLTQEEFYEKLKKDEPISTSQPSPADLCDLWDKLLRDYEEIVHIPMSSGLSASCSTAMGLAIDYNGRVQVVDNQRISVTQRQSVMDAKMLAEAGKSAAEIKKILTDQKFDSSIYITLDTLKISEEGRKNHTGGSSYRNSSQPETGASDPGREAGCLCKSPWQEAGETCHAEGYEERLGDSFPGICCKR